MGGYAHVTRNSGEGGSKAGLPEFKMCQGQLRLPTLRLLFIYLLFIYLIMCTAREERRGRAKADEEEESTGGWPPEADIFDGRRCSTTMRTTV